MLETIKAHPYWTAGAVIVAIILFVMLRGGGGQAVGTYTTGSDVGAATGLQTAQLQASSQAGQIQAALQANATNTAAQIELAKIAAQQSGAHDQLAAEVATSQISSEAQVSTLMAQLASNIQIHGQDTSLANTTVLASNQTQQQQIFASALTHQADVQASTYNSAIQAQKDIATQSWWDKTFG